MPGDQDDNTPEIALSIDETNALRIKLGLKPLSAPSQSQDKQKEAEDNFENHRIQAQKAKEAEELRDKIAKAKTRRELNKKLQGKSLGTISQSEEPELDDSLAWVERQKLRQKQLAEQSARESLRQSKQQESEYSSKDLKGLRIAHDIDEFGDSSENILVLKDTSILENEEQGDELEAIQLSEAAKRRKNLETKKKAASAAKGYNVYDQYDHEAVMSGKRAILSQYDDDEDTERGVLVLGDDGGIRRRDDDDLGGNEDTGDRRRRIGESLKNAISLEYDTMQEMADYYTKEEISFKKPKKKKKKERKTRRKDDFEEGEEMDNNESSMDVDTDSKPIARTKYEFSNKTADISDMNFVDDDDLQAALSRARRKVLLTNQAQRQQRDLEVVERLKRAQEVSNSIEEMNGGVEYLAVKRDGVKMEEDNDDEEESDSEVEGQGIVLSATTEFVRNLPTVPMYLESKMKQEEEVVVRVKKEVSEEIVKPEITDQDGDTTMQNESEWNAIMSDVKPEIKPEIKQEDEDAEEEEWGGIVEEPLVARGLAATVALLSQKGQLEKVSEDVVESERMARERATWMLEQKKRDLMKKGSKKRARDYDDDYDEQEAIYAERQRAKELEAKFKDYKPNVQLNYYDEQGRSLNAKEAFRQLSHKFHGMTSGKLKTEKRMKKIEDEMKLQAMASGDTPLGTASALLERTKATGSTHVVLSVGNRGVPLLDDKDLKKPGNAKKK